MSSNCSVVIVGAARTPIGSLTGALSSLKAHELGSVAIKEALQRAGVSGEDVTDVILGEVIMAGAGQNPARIASVNAGIPYTSTALTINMNCGSGLKSVCLGAGLIKLGEAKVVVCGGMESMSQAPHVINQRQPTKFGDVKLVDTILHDSLVDPFYNYHMGVTAENVASQFEVTREDQDKFSEKSQQKTAVAVKEGYFKAEITPVTISSRRGNTVVDQDEFPKPNTTFEGLQKLRPAFKTDGSGTVTAGNASGINDGAAAFVLMSEADAQSRGVKSLARIVSYGQCGLDPSIMGVGPIGAVRKALESAGWSMDSVDLFELNEAFAAQSVAVARELKVDEAKLNIHGGSISLGHPVGASGARILVTLLYALERTCGKRGVASLCIGGGMGIALCVERS